MVDFRKFLKPADERCDVLFLGGLVAFAKDRTLRLSELPNVAPGFYSARVSGRRAQLGEPAEPFGLDQLPAKIGHFADGYLAMDGARSARLELVGAAEPDVLAPVRARLHSTGALLLGETLFETEAEGEARQRLDAGRGLADVRGVPATLRAAFAFATTLRLARERGIPVSAAEIAPQLLAIADRGPEAALALLVSLSAQREAEANARQQADRDRQLARAYEGLRETARASVERARAAPPSRLDAVERAERALAAAQATLLSARRLQGGQLEVRFRLLGEIFLSIVDAETLHVFDAGICLAGADEEVTLESLPSVIREAIDEHRLVITRR